MEIKPIQQRLIESQSGFHVLFLCFFFPSSLLYLIKTDLLQEVVDICGYNGCLSE